MSRNKKDNDTFDALLQSSGAARRGGRRGRKALLIALIFACFFVLAFCGLCAAGYAVTHDEKNLPNVYIDDVFVGGMTREETAAALDKAGFAERAEGEVRVTLPAQICFTVKAAEAGAALTPEAAVTAATEYGHSGSWLDNLFSYLRCLLTPVNVAEGLTSLNDGYIDACIQKGAAAMTEATRVSGYSVDSHNNRLVMIKGGGELKLDERGLHEAIVKELVRGVKELSYDTLAAPIQSPDFEKIYRDLAVEPEDAAFDEYFNVIPEVLGCTFDVEQAQKLWNGAAPGQKVFVPLEITEPETGAEDLNALLFRDLLGSQTTSYMWSTDNRINNIKLACGKLDGYIMLPDEVFSYNETVGQRTEAAGFLTASAYSDGEVVEALGGGICQVSSTLYCAEMYAQLRTTSRTNHYFKVDYLDYGYDATVSWTSPDFKFKNNRSYPIKIAAYCNDDDQTLTIEIWGTDLDGSYVTLRHSDTEVYDEEWGVHIGYTVTTYRDVYDCDGNYLSTVTEPSGVYYFHDENIDWPEGHEKATALADIYLDRLER